MEATRNQRTIARPASVAGIGYWSGCDVQVEFCPAEPETGIVFVRTDLQDRPRIPATIENRTETPLRTTLRCGDAGVDMIEHVMAALAGLQIDNCEVRVDQQEMPGCDGSALPLVEALDSVGVVEQDAPRGQLVVRDTVRLGDQRSWIEIRPSSSAETILQCKLDYGRDTAIGRQKFCISLSPERFRRELASSRTFVLEHEAAALQAQGLGKRTTFKDLLVFGPDGPIDNRLRFSDECVRHKLLDMVGDLALAGCDLIGRFVAYRSGHQLNAEAVRAILARAETREVLQRCA